MFEGFVSQVLAGYLGRYVKGIQKDQLKIGIWNEEVLLDNVELILEAFDYLQLPFALKQGKIGKLSIKIPWKKLGWDPIVIQLEDVFICACSRDNDDWSLNSVEKRELAGKMSKLNAAELAKFSKRFYGNQVGQYVFAKILDNIQVSIKNVHIVYIDTHADKENFLFGLRFSSLTVMTDPRKLNPIGSSYGMFKAGQVKKILKISTLGIYCNLFEDNMSIEDDPVVILCNDSKFDLKRYDYLINPFDLTIFLLVNKSGMCDTSPEYSVVAELSSVVMLLNDVQLLQILSLWDHLSICSLRERYGRYRPDYPFSLQKVGRWQILWWHYAQQSVLADVRRRLKKTSWSSLGKRITQRRKYVNLYRTKLELIQQNQHVREDILEELDQMDRECEIDEILSYRSTAENQIEDFILQKKDPSTDENEVSSSQEKGQNDDRSFTRLRGWLNWLSLGMLGAGGTADSSSFAGVVSDEIIKDIYEATDSQPLPVYTGNESYERNMIISSVIKFDINHFTMTLSSKKHCVKDVALIFLDGVGVECKIWEESVAITFLMKSVKITNPCNDCILLTSEQIGDCDDSSRNTPCFCAHIKAPPTGRTFDISVEAVLQGIRITYDLDVLKDVSEFITALENLQFQSQRVMLSFSGFTDVNVRVLSKAEYIFMTQKKILWDVIMRDVDVKISQISDDSESHIMVLKLGTLHLKSKPRRKTDSTVVDIQEYFSGYLMNIPAAYNLPSTFELEDLYEHLVIDLTSFEGNVLSTKSNNILPVFGKFSATIILSLCMFLDEPALKQLDVNCSLSAFDAHISPLLFGALSRLVSKPKEKFTEDSDKLDISPVARSSSLILSWCSASLQLDRFNFILDLDGDPHQSSAISISLMDSNIRYNLHDSIDFNFNVNSMSISGHVLNAEPSYILCSSRSREFLPHGSEAVHPAGYLLDDKCFAFQYHTHENGSRTHTKCTIELSGLDFHIHPIFIGVVLESYSRIFVHRQYSVDNSLSSSVDVSFQSAIVNNKSLVFEEELKSGCIVILAVDFNLREVRAHFHDSSSVLATLSCPFLKASFFLKGIDSWEAVFLFDGLSLASLWSNASWSSPNISDILWGPSSPTIASTLNIHVKNFRDEVGYLIMETYVKLQHVNCILPPEFLAMVFGYFSLPDWIPRRKELHATEIEHLSPVYKFEIFDSSLFLPVENKAFCFQLSLPKVSGCFNPDFHSIETLKSIPSGCLIPQVEVAGMLHLLNVSTRGSSLSAIMCDHGTVGSISGPHSSTTNVAFLPLIDADIWVTFPQSELSSVPTSIMLNSDACNLVIEDEWFLQGIEAIGICIDELSNVIDDSTNFKSDAWNYIQLKKKMKEKNAVATISPEIPIDIKICANTLSLKLVRSASSEVVAGMNTKLMLLALLRNNTVSKLDADIMYIVMHSYLNSVVLLSFLSENSSTYTSISFLMSERGGNEFQFSIPFFDIWLHYSDWNNVIDLVNTFERFSDSASDLTLESSPPESELRNHHEVDLIVKSDKMVLSLHLPVNHIERSTDNKGTNGFLDIWKNILGDSVPPIQRLDSQYLTFALQSRDMVLTLSNRGMIIHKCSTGRMKMIIKLTGNQGFHSMSVIQFFLGKVSVEIHQSPQNVFVTISDVKVETFTLNLLQELVKISEEIEFATSGTSNWGMTLPSVFFHVHLVRLSMLFSDQQLQSSGPIFEITCKNMLVEGETSTKLTVESHLSVNYKNFQKVMWEPFIEPWSFCLKLIQHVNSGSPNRADTKELSLSSLQELNFNITESLVEAIFLMHRMLNESLDLKGSYKGHESCGHLMSEANHNALRSHAPYIISNETSLPLSFWVFYGPSTTENSNFTSIAQRNIIQPGFSVPVYLESPEINVPKKASYSSERLLERKLNPVSHHHISVQLDGTSSPSKPMSMDLVGISYFDVNFSKSRASETSFVADQEASLKGRDNESYITDPSNGLVVPVVFDVSMHFYSKMIRLYSTVLLLNATSKNLELRFDIPFGVSPKIFGPILPGQEFPLPVHLAEAVGMRWRPVDSDYFWSEAHSLSKILSHENRLGLMKSVVCYPSFPKSDPFRCCMSIEDRSAVYPYGAKGGSSLHINSTSENIKFNERERQDHGKSKKVFIRQVRLTTPLLIKNNLPSPLTVTVDSAGVMTSICLSEVDAASIFHVDSSHDLDITFKLEAYDPVISRFPRAEIFTVITRHHETRFLTSDQLSFYPNKHNAHILGPVSVKVDKAMDAHCGAREICISVPFLLYNCTSLPLGIIDDDLQRKGHPHFIPSCFSLVGDEDPPSESHGISVLSSGREMKTNQLKFLKTYKPAFLPSGGNDSLEGACVNLKKSTFNGNRASQPSSSENSVVMENEGTVKPYMYSPPCHLSENDLVVRLQKYSFQQHVTVNWNDTWSSPFSLVPESGSTSVVIPQPRRSGAFLLSVTSSQISGDLGKMSRAVIFQPRYVICNSCSKHLYYKQKGTSDSHSMRLNVGQHSHLHWTDITRDLLVCIRFDERGGQWSGSFLPDFLGDTQVKVHNHVSGALDMVRVEIQNASMLVEERKDVDLSNGNSGTYLILLSDDDSGFMPYRIDNFSMESLRIYQQKCETAEITLRAYASCQYAWDEPFCPHRLVVKMPGELLLGTYNLDDVKEYQPVCLPSSSEKPERRFFVAVRAEGATKVLSIVDSRYHRLKDIGEIEPLGKEGKRKLSQQEEMGIDFSDKIILHLPFIGISLMNSSPQEIIYVSAKEMIVILIQSPNKQRVSFQISSLQIDNQLPDAPYPILLSFDRDQRNRDNILMRQMNDLMEDDHESDIYFSASKWRKESSFVSFEYISTRVAPVTLELEELVLLQILAFLRAALSKFENEHLELRTAEHNHGDKNHPLNNSALVFCHFHKNPGHLPRVVPIGAPWQRICLLARHQKRIYIETFQLAPVRLTVSFSSNPWLTQKEDLLEAESFLYIRSIAFQFNSKFFYFLEGKQDTKELKKLMSEPFDEQLSLLSLISEPRGLMALVDVESVPFHLKELVLTNLMASRESVQEIVTKHYTKQLLHEIYKIFGSAGLIGNPMGFARNVGMGIKDFLSVSSKGIVQSPTGLITGVAQGSKSLLGNTIYAMSSAASQFSKAVHKGIVAFTFDEQVSGKMENQQSGHDSHGKGILNEILEGLTGLLQSPIRGAEKHGLPGVLSGIILGTAGLVARPVVSILETTEKAAQTIKKISSPQQSKRFRTRLPRPLARDLPLSPYSWEEAIGVSMLLEADNARLKDEIFIKCRALKDDGKFIIITERLIVVVYCSALVGLGKPAFLGVADVMWVVETEMPTNSIIHMDREVMMVNIIGSKVETLVRQNRTERLGLWDPSASVPLFQMSVGLTDEEAAEDVLQTLWSIKERGDFQNRSLNIIHRSNMR